MARFSLVFVFLFTVFFTLRCTHRDEGSGGYGYNHGDPERGPASSSAMNELFRLYVGDRKKNYQC